MHTLIAFLCAALWLATAGLAAAAPEGTLTIAMHFSPVTRWLDPAEGESTITPYLMLAALHDGLLRPTAGKASAPSLAESWSMAKDMTSAEFTLRKARFHNGDPVTAEDVKFSFERYRGGAAKVLKDGVKEIQVLGPSRVRFVFKEAVARLPGVLRHVRGERGLGGAEGLLRARGRGRFPQGAGRRRALQVRELQPGRRAGRGGVRRLLAKAPVHQENHLPQPSRRDHARGRAQERRGGPGHAAERPHRAGDQADARPAPGRAAARHLLARLPGPVGSRSRRGPTSACGWPRAWPSTARP